MSLEDGHAIRHVVPRSYGSYVTEGFERGAAFTRGADCGGAVADCDQVNLFQNEVLTRIRHDRTKEDRIPGWMESLAPGIIEWFSTSASACMMLFGFIGVVSCMFKLLQAGEQKLPTEANTSLATQDLLVSFKSGQGKDVQMVNFEPPASRNCKKFGASDGMESAEQGATVDDVPNFSGKYLLVKTVGDMDKFLSNSGVSILGRIFERGLNYSLGRETLEIIQVGNAFQIVCSGLWTSKIWKFLVNAGPQRGGDMDNHRHCSHDAIFVLDPKWDGQVLRVDFLDINGDIIQTWRQYVEQGLLYQQRKSCKGAVVEFAYCKTY